MVAALAAVQMTGRAGRPQENRERTVALAAAAAREGARLVVLPELVVSSYTLERAILEDCAEPLDGPTFAAWHALAAREQVLVAGGFCERDGDRLYNSAILVGPDGLLLHYRKLHLFDREKTVFAPGDLGLPVADTFLGRVGLCVCYDLRFVEVMRAIALRDAAIVAVPTAWVAGFDRKPRDAGGLIAQARGAALQANLNQVYAVCASQPGSNGDIAFLGSSLIVDPFGETLAGPLSDAQETTILAPFDPGAVTASRERSALVRPREDRRTDVYGLSIGGAVL